MIEAQLREGEKLMGTVVGVAVVGGFVGFTRRGDWRKV